jgi:hypothetical protein
VIGLRFGEQSFANQFKGEGRREKERIALRLTEIQTKDNCVAKHAILNYILGIVSNN